MGDANLNPMEGVYREFEKIINNLTIKYSVEAEKYETYESKKLADEYLDAFLKRDDFRHYRDFTVKDFNSVGIYARELMDNTVESVSRIPERFHEPLLTIARNRIIDNYVEQNDYYRMLDGYPPLNTPEMDFHYVPKEILSVYGVTERVPIHLIQDYFNKKDPGEGDRIINIVEGIGYIDKLKAAYPDDTYLNYLGPYRIPIYQSRIAKNFQVLQLKNGTIKGVVYENFLTIYEQSRDYFMSVIFNPQFRSFMDYYDNFIAMCIMIMTINQMVMRQLQIGINRNFYDLYAIRMLYEAYGVPYNLALDEETQQGIVQNLNILINNKSTNKVIYDIAHLLGYTNINVYKYYLSKVRKYDTYGVPIVKYVDKFNSDTGMVERVPDYQAMYDLYFQKEELKEDDFIQTLNDKVNVADYTEITSGDPFWIEDQDLFDRIWETEYNFVESKYLGLGISYRMTDMVFENILLFKLLMSQSGPLKNVTVTLPKILEKTSVPIFDIVILMICLVAKKHNLTGEIIEIPDQVINVMDYMENLDASSKYLVDSFGFNFDYFSPDNEEGFATIKKLEEILDPESAEKFKEYIKVLSFNSDASPSEKIKTLNLMYSNIKNLSELIMLCMSDASDREVYDTLQTFYRAAFYSKEVRDVFTVTPDATGKKRTAFTYFEFLYHYNPKLYNAVFIADLDRQYNEYLEKNGLDIRDLSYQEYLIKVDNREIHATYDTLLQTTYDDNNKVDDLIYYYCNHIISRLSTIINDVNFMYLLNDTATPLEELLLKLIRFFKSLTVDLVNIDTIYVCDIKPENMIRFIDEIEYIEKTIVPVENMRISYSDLIHAIGSTQTLDDFLKLKDDQKYSVTIWINKDDNESVELSDKIHLVVKDIYPDDQFSLYDAAHHTNSTYELEERHGVHFRDAENHTVTATIEDVEGFRFTKDTCSPSKTIETYKEEVPMYDTQSYTNSTYELEERYGVHFRDAENHTVTATIDVDDLCKIHAEGYVKKTLDVKSSNMKPYDALIRRKKTLEADDQPGIQLYDNRHTGIESSFDIKDDVYIHDGNNVQEKTLEINSEQTQMTDSLSIESTYEIDDKSAFRLRDKVARTWFSE